MISLETLSTGNRTHIKAGDIIINFMALSKYRNKIYERHSLVNSSTILKKKKYILSIYISKHPYNTPCIFHATVSIYSLHVDCGYSVYNSFKHFTRCNTS